MKKGLLVAVAGGAAALSLAGAGTFASWSDYATKPAGTVGAGKLDVTLSNGASTSLFDNLKLAPGIGIDRVVDVASSDGESVPDGKLTVSFPNLVEHEDKCTSQTELDLEVGACDVVGDQGEFGNEALLKLRVWNMPTAQQVAQSNLPPLAKGILVGLLTASPNVTCQEAVASLGDAINQWLGVLPVDFQGTIDQATAQTSIDPGVTLKPGGKACIAVSVELPTTASNAVQGDSSTFDVRADLTQV